MSRIDEEWARKQVAALRAEVNDPEVAHWTEDEAMRQFIAALAAGQVDEPRKVAAILCQMEDVDFTRWYA